MMEETSLVSRAVPGGKHDPTPTTSPRSSRSSSRSSGHKRQRLESRKSMDSSADFISLDFSDGDGVGPIEEKYISARCKPALQESTESNTPVTTNGSGAEEKGDDQEGGMEEKTASKRKRRAKKKGAKEATEAVAKQGAHDMEEKPEPPSLKAGGEPSDEENGGIKIASTSSSNSKDGESEEEGEDKDSFTRRALEAKKQNGIRAPGESEIEKLDTVEAAVVTAANPEVRSVNLSDGAVAAAEKEPERDAGGMIVKDRKIARKKERKRQKDARRAEKRARRKERKKAQADVPKGGGFKNPPDGKVDDVVEISSDDDDGYDSGLEINVDLDIDDIEGEKAKNNDKGGEEGEAAEATTENVDGPSEDNGDSSDNSNNSSNNNNNNGSDESPLVDQAIAIQQRKYYTAFAPPHFRLEEARSLFAPIGKVDFTADLVQEQEVLAAAAAEALRESKRICNVCTRKGHSEDKCEELKCKHCGSWNKHFSHSCPDAKWGEEDKPCVKDKWRRIPSHFHNSITFPSTSSLPIFCYSCAGNDHFGDDCPRYAPPKVLGSFSLTDINTNTYATQEWLLNFSDKLEILESDSGKSKATFGKEGTKMTVKPPPDPFRDFRNNNDSLPKRPLPPPTGPARGGGRNSDSYKSRAAPRDGNGGSYRQRSPTRDPVFDRHRDPRDTLPPRPQGLSQRPRSRSPPRYRSGGGGRGGGGGGRAGSSGGHMYRPPADYRNRPAPREGSGGDARGGYNGGGGRAHESRLQPPLPNEPAPRRGDAFRPMPSSAKSNWQRHTT